jgi:hypothetical protein
MADSGTGFGEIMEGNGGRGKDESAGDVMRGT